MGNENMFDFYGNKEENEEEKEDVTISDTENEINKTE